MFFIHISHYFGKNIKPSIKKIQVQVSGESPSFAVYGGHCCEDPSLAGNELTLLSFLSNGEKRKQKMPHNVSLSEESPVVASTQQG